MRPRSSPQSAGVRGIFLLVIGVFVTGCGAVVSPKKGVGAWYFPHVDKAIAEINVSWFYTWEPNTKGITQPDRVEFVPMIWSETFVEPKQLELAKKSGSVLLGFNEPDRAEQANMTVKQALDLWPHLMATGMRIGSPATAGNPSLSGSWLEQFMDGAKARGYRVDFVCVHWYGEEFEIDGALKQLKNFLQAVHQKFQLPIWLTEYSLIRWSNTPTYPSWEQQVRFASRSIDMLETLPFVERYAWFSLPPWTKHGGDRTSLYYQDGDLTPVGVAYQKGPITPPSGNSQAPVASQR
jgi:Glycosyl hydrolase catalytic core